MSVLKCSSLQECFTTQMPQTVYNNSQENWYGTLVPGAMPTSNSSPAPIGFDQAIRGVDPYLSRKIPIKQNAHQLFLPGTSSALNSQQNICQTTSIDDLINTQNPDTSVRCGWMYSHPSGMNPLPQVSRGGLGTRNGAFSALNPNMNYQKWFWDLNQAKQQIAIDTCKSLKDCTNVGNAPYAGVCGYCSDIQQGIPIDSAGNPLYPNNSLTYCSPSSLVSAVGMCSPPVPSAGNGPMPQINNTCTPIGGRLPLACIQQLVEEGGCSTNGTLANALNNGATPADYMAGAWTLQSTQLYNKYATQPLSASILGQGNATIAQVLGQIGQLASDASMQGTTTAVGASARDLCLQSGAIGQYDICSELQSTSLPPYSISCVQQLFLQSGGQPDGSMYPTPANMSSFYNLLSSWNAVITYIQGLVSTSQGGGIQEGFYNGVGGGPTNMTQRAALFALRGIQLDDPLIGSIWYGLTSKLVQVCVANSTFMAGVDATGTVWVRNASGWNSIPGPVAGIPVAKATVTTDGVVIVLSGSTSPSEYNVYMWNGAVWTHINVSGTDNGLADISSPTTNSLVGTSLSGNIYSKMTTMYIQRSGNVSQISNGVDGSMMGVISSIQSIWAHGPVVGIWYPVAGIQNAKKVAVGSATNIWYIDTLGGVWKMVGTFNTNNIGSASIKWPTGGSWNGHAYTGLQWISVPGIALYDISVSLDGITVGITTGGSLVYWNGASWNIVFQ